MNMIYRHLEHTFIPQLAHVHLKKQDDRACTSANIYKTQPQNVWTFHGFENGPLLPPIPQIV